MKIAIVTGASTGLGREFVSQLHSHFPDIEECWVIARRENKLSDLSDPAMRITPFPLDLTVKNQIEILHGSLEKEKPTVSLLINNAGCGFLGDFANASLEEQLQMCKLNIEALTAVTHTVLPFMVRGSRIINISSIASFVSTPRMTVYSATKAYVSFFSRGLHEELRPRGITVTAVCPGPMDTEFISVGRIKGKSKTFDILPYCNPKKVVKGALKAAKNGRAVYTPKLFYKFYRVLSGLIPHAILVHAAKT